MFTFLMNKAKYNSLPADLKKVIDDNSGRNIARATGENWLAIEQPGLKVMKSKSKNKFSTLRARRKRPKSGKCQKWSSTSGLPK